MRISQRAQKIEPFYVMEVAKAASALAAQSAQTDKPMIFLNIGEPDFSAPPLVQEAGQRAIRAGHTQYTQATGLAPLREHISAWYASRFNVQIPARRIVLTAGASAALQLACLALVEAGDEILMPDPSYPCNRHFVSAADGTAKLIACTPQERFQLTAAKVEAAWTAKSRGELNVKTRGELNVKTRGELNVKTRGELNVKTRGELNVKTRGVLLASPSNPTGTSIHPDELRRIHQVVSTRGGVTMIDEIYLGLSHDATFGRSALEIDDQIISINSFSKYFGMTGWRLGWLVVPDALVSVVERLAQNLYICPSTVSQHAALACFDSASIAEYEKRRAEFKARRDYFIPALRSLGFEVPVEPDGAFYVYADCSKIQSKLGVQAASGSGASAGVGGIGGSWDFCFEMMHRAHVAITPGRDFGTDSTHQFVRFSTASSMADLQTAVARMQKVLA
jgi:aspartate/methionine/tyrosine aminotransferase